MTDFEPQQEQLCVAWGCKRSCARGYLCHWHYQHGLAWLRDIEDEAASLSPVKSMALSNGERGGGLASEQSVGKLDVIALRDKRSRPGDGTDPELDLWGGDTLAIMDVLGSWASVVREERRIKAPTRMIIGVRAPGTVGPYCDHLCEHQSCATMAPRWIVPVPATVTSERRILTVHWDWVCEQAWVDELIDQVKKLRGQLKRSNDTIEVPAGTCSTIYGADPCGGQVWHITIKHEVEPDEQGFRCGTCRRTWTGTDAVRKRNELWVEEQQRKATA